MPRVLKLAVDNFDQVNTFNVQVTKTTVAKCSLKRDYDKRGDGIYWAMNPGTTLKSHYSEADRAEAARLTLEFPVRNGEIVMIEGKEYRTRVLGAYSDCAIFDPL